MKNPDMEFREKLARGFLVEAKQDMDLKRWRSCVDNSQLSVENAAKMAFGIFGSVAKNHRPGKALIRLIEEGRFPAALQAVAERLAECAEKLGPETHVQSDYGDETTGLTPWEIFGVDEARDTLAIAEEALALARQLRAWAESQD